MVRAGNLQFHLPQWKNLCPQNTFVLQTVGGYKLKLPSPVEQHSLPPPPDLSAEEHRKMTNAISDLIAKDAIEACSPSAGQYVSPFFLRPKPDGSSRFILNLKSFNRTLTPPHFKMEDLRAAIHLMRKDASMATIDLKDAYFAVPIDTASRKFFRFIFEGQLFQFTCLPFGFCLSPYLFTKIMKPVMAQLRLQGITGVIYLDDIWLSASSPDECRDNVNATLSLLTSLGFTINKDKCKLSPSQQCQFLGFLLNSRQMSISLPDEKRSNLVTAVEALLRRRRCRIVELAQVIGQLIAACPASTYGFRHTKDLERDKVAALKAHNGDFQKTIYISSAAMRDLLWWRNSIPSVVRILRPDSFDLVLFTDASGDGWGASSDKASTHGLWSESERREHINYLELLAVQRALLTLADQIKGKRILLRIDNQTAISYINKMGGIRLCRFNDLSQKIWDWAEERDNFLVASYITSAENRIADKLSRLRNDDTEWSLGDEFFAYLQKELGQPAVDLFAAKWNNKCARYVSWFPDTAAEEVDAFTLDWDSLDFYAFPPFSLILRVLTKLEQDGAEGIVVVPNWPNQPWFPSFHRLAISPILVLGPHINLVSSIYRSTHPVSSLQLLAARLSTKHSRARAHQRE